MVVRPPIRFYTKVHDWRQKAYSPMKRHVPLPTPSWSERQVTRKILSYDVWRRS